MKTICGFVTGALLLGVGSLACGYDLEEVVQHMNASAASIKDVAASAKVTRYDSVFEETHVSTRRLYFQRPHLARVDTFEERKGRQVLTQQFILGKDFALQVWPETHHGELHKLTSEQIERMSTDRNDPISFFGRNIDEIRKDFRLEQVPVPKGAPANSTALVITPANKEVKFDYAKVEMVIDTGTWLPRSIKSYVGGDKEDWTLYEFTDIKLNPGLKEDTFSDKIPGIKIEVVEDKQEKSNN